MSKLFDQIVSDDKLCPQFIAIRDTPGDHPGRLMLEDVFENFVDEDGNFIEQFQSAGFNARFFELYLHAVFSREGYISERPQDKPDFIIKKNGASVAVEVTTVNPSTGGPMSKIKPIAEMTREERVDYEQDALPIKFGSSLFSKLKKKYWELAHCKGLPLVLFIEAFHDEDSLSFSENAITSYLYGLRPVGEWDGEGQLRVESEKVEIHKTCDKEIPSNFFGLPDSEYISAVVFTNSGTLAKFSRMGFLHGYGNKSYKLIRFGTCYNNHPDAMDPSLFRYDLEQPPFVESWSNGLSVFLNPNARHPLPAHYFGDVNYYMIDDGLLATKVASWSAVSSITKVLFLDEIKEKFEPMILGTPGMIEAIPRRVFAEAVGHTNTNNPRFEEDGWFSDYGRGFYGVVIKLRDSATWQFYIFARSINCEMYTINMSKQYASRRKAVQDMQWAMLALSIRPKRYFKA